MPKRNQWKRQDAPSEVGITLIIIEAQVGSKLTYLTAARSEAVRTTWIAAELEGAIRETGC